MAQATAASGETTPAIQRQPDRNLALDLLRVTEAAAMAAGRWVGRRDKDGADAAAVAAMRAMMGTVAMDGVVVIGEGEKDDAPMLYNGERVGSGTEDLVSGDDAFFVMTGITDGELSAAPTT